MRFRYGFSPKTEPDLSEGARTSRERDDRTAIQSEARTQKWTGRGMRCTRRRYQCIALSDSELSLQSCLPGLPIESHAIRQAKITAKFESAREEAALGGDTRRD